jgi:hypothetical protein
MKYNVSRTLYAYWRALKGHRKAPDRSEINPAQIRTILKNTFILELSQNGTVPFRLAGTSLCSLYCRELKNFDFVRLWGRKEKEPFLTLLNSIHDEGAAAVFGLKGTSSRGHSLSMEMLLLPMTYKSDQFTRVLGSLVTEDEPFWIGVYPITKLRIQSLRLIWPDEDFHQDFEAYSTASLQPDVFSIDSLPSPVSRYKHLRVYDGGLSDSPS